MQVCCLVTCEFTSTSGARNKSSSDGQNL
uniref:Uncharacterized protein n=1 Tax=Anguilla anguilla TaxID=7936 RepID=A0A0E9VJM2_ANGAN